jgi:hypothetical protein
MPDLLFSVKEFLYEYLFTSICKVKAHIIFDDIEYLIYNYQNATYSGLGKKTRLSHTNHKHRPYYDFELQKIVTFFYILIALKSK